MRMLRWADKTRSCEKCRHLERNQEKDITDGGKWQVKLRQIKAEMARPGETGYGKKQDDI